MDDKLIHHITMIVDNARLLLSNRIGALTQDQTAFVRTILSNAEKFIHIYAEFDRARPEEIKSSMRHELGTPLTPIRGYSDLLVRPVAGELNKAQRECVKTIRQSTIVLVEEIKERVAEAYATK